MDRLSVRWSGLFSSTALALATVVLSETARGEDVDGWYAGIGAGSSHVEVYRGGLSGFGGWEASAGDSTTLIFGGYRLNDYFAIDLSYLPERDLEWREEGALVSGLPGYYDSRTSLSTSALQLSVLGILRYREIGEVYLRGGASKYRASVVQNMTDYFSGEQLVQSFDGSDTGFLLGVGIAAGFSQSWRVRLEYQIAWIDHGLINVEEQNDPTVDTWFLGFDRRFGSR